MSEFHQTDNLDTEKHVSNSMWQLALFQINRNFPTSITIEQLCEGVDLTGLGELVTQLQFHLQEQDDEFNSKV